MKIPQAAIAHAVEQYPKESCGLIVAGEYIPCFNAARDPLENFAIGPGEYKRALAKGAVEAVVHSHPDATSAASATDLRNCDESQVPWLILSVCEGEYTGGQWHTPDAPLLGRHFVHGAHDCLGLVLDYYKREMGIDLGQYERKDNWWHEGGDLYREYLPQAGFVQVPSADLQQGDVILMQIRAPVPNHAGVYLADGKLKTEPEHFPAPGCIIHHLYGRDSVRDPYGGMWLERTVGVWRYVGKTENNPPVRKAGRKVRPRAPSGSR